MSVWERLRRWLGLGIQSDGAGQQVQEAVPTPGKPQKIRSISRVQASDEAETPEFDLAEVNQIFEIDSYARQAVTKYIEFMFKQGYDFSSENQKALQYIKTRFATMAEATSIPTEVLFIQVAEDLVKYHNAFIVKARNADFKWPNGVKVRGIYGRKPIAGLFVVDPTTMKVKRNEFGQIQQWEQEVEGADKTVKLKPEDVVHIPYQVQRGQVFGHPWLLTAREDILATRQLEDLVLRMIHRYISPFIHYKVGTPEMPATEEEIDQAWQYIQNADPEGGLVTSERHEIKPVALNQVIDPAPILKYFEARVFTACGVSETLMGRGEGASRSTSESMYGEFLDRVKAYQRVIEAYVNHFIIREMLLEGGFDPLTNGDRDDVRFEFREIDFDAQVKYENAEIFKFEHNIQTWDETRAAIGRKPQVDESRLYLNMITLPQIRAKNSEGDSTNTADTANRVSPQNQRTKNAAEDGPEAVLSQAAASLQDACGAPSDDTAQLIEALIQGDQEVTCGGIHDQQAGF